MNTIHSSHSIARSTADIPTQKIISMKIISLLSASLLAITPLLAESSTNDGNPFATTPSKDSQEKIETGVQITELGLMRALLVLDNSSSESEKLIEQRLNEADFRVFPSAQIVGSRLSASDVQKIGKEANADLVVYASASARPKQAMGDFQLFEGEATVQLFSPVTGELLVTHTARTDGTRTTDAVTAERGAREKALDLATKEAIVLSLEKAHKIMVYQAILTGVQNNTDLLFFMESIARMEGIYHVRRISWNPETKEAEIEIIASPKAETFWRAQIEAIPKRKVKVTSYHSKPQSSGVDAIPAWLKNK
jgi:hypothetical protein